MTVDLPTPRSIEDVIKQSRHILEAGTFEVFMRYMRTHVPAPERKHIGVFTRMAVQQFQNWQLDENPRLRLSDAQLLAVMRTEFPVNEGKVFTGTLDEGLKIVSGIRADYNRTGHNGPTPHERGMPPSVSYGRFGMSPPHFRLRFDQQRVAKYAAAYVYDNGQTQEIEERIAPRVRQARVYTKADFLKVCYWKSPRTRKWCASNDARSIEIITRAALTSDDERVRIETLTTLNGVSWPTASTLLHFGHPDEYPILDYRALWSLGVDPPPPYEFGLWERYVGFCRELARKCRVDVRTLDKALWQYSKKHQRPSRNRNR